MTGGRTIRLVVADDEPQAAGASAFLVKGCPAAQLLEAVGA
jgi:hypothetical protein